MNMANKRTGSEYTIDLRYYGTFDETARSVLGKAVQDEMRIFIVISDKTGTRNTLCEVCNGGLYHSIYTLVYTECEVMEVSTVL